MYATISPSNASPSIGVWCSMQESAPRWRCFFLVHRDRAIANMCFLWSIYLIFLIAIIWYDTVSLDLVICLIYLFNIFALGSVLFLSPLLFCWSYEYYCGSKIFLFDSSKNWCETSVLSKILVDSMTALWAGPVLSRSWLSAGRHFVRSYAPPMCATGKKN